MLAHANLSTNRKTYASKRWSGRAGVEEHECQTATIRIYGVRSLVVSVLRPVGTIS